VIAMHRVRGACGCNSARVDAGRGKPRAYKRRKQIQKQVEKTFGAWASRGAAVLRPYVSLPDSKPCAIKNSEKILSNLNSRKI